MSFKYSAPATLNVVRKEGFYPNASTAIKLSVACYYAIGEISSFSTLERYTAADIEKWSNDPFFMFFRGVAIECIQAARPDSIFWLPDVRELCDLLMAWITVDHEYESSGEINPMAIYNQVLFITPGFGSHLAHAVCFNSLRISYGRGSSVGSILPTSGMKEES